MSETPAQRTMRARGAALQSWANTSDRAARSKNGQDGLRAKYAREIDPDGTMPADQLKQRLDARMKRHFTDLARRSSIARAKKKAS